ncbi:MAG: hypothetical protein N3F63_03925 [Thermoplasmata archaeon]|nr:hypothetical protein [Thermoplasmata archaeon]
MLKIRIVLGMIMLALIVTAVAGGAHGAQKTEVIAPAATGGNVEVGIYQLSIGNFDLAKGTFVADFYLVFKWVNASISPVAFEFINGRAASKEKIFENITNGSCEMWYRIQANLYMSPEFTNYPFDAQYLPIIIEDAKNNNSAISYRVSQDLYGYDNTLTVPGWKVEGSEILVEDHEYPWGEVYSRVVFAIKLVRDAGATAAKLMLPPIIFCIVSGLSFFFKADKITHRLGLGTSTLISAVMFHLSQTTSLPPLPSLILIDKIMISVYGFLASSLVATTLIYIDEEFWKDVDYTKQVNRYGAIFTIVFPFVVFAVLYYFV